MQAMRQDSLTYAGDVSAAECWDALSAEPNATLIDVRTQAEWVFVGLPNLQTINKKINTISWKMYPTLELNPDFVGMVESVAPNKDTPLYFLCKTGGRSLDAAIAMTQAGYSHCYNVADGFEGDRDALVRRGLTNGWKASQLPWEQQ